MTEARRLSTGVSDKTYSASVFARQFVAIVPGVVLTAVIAVIAFALRHVPGMAIFSPMILATLIGVIVGNTFGAPAVAKPGIVFSLRRILRFGIILLGLQLMASQIVQVGFAGFGIILTTLAVTIVFTKWFGALIGVDRKVAELIAAGTAICGASAVIATNTVTNGSDEDVAYAVACVTVFGSLSMFLFPLFPALLHLNAEAFGLWSGSAIHEIAQVVAAAYQDGQIAGQIATVTKLTRVMMLAPLVISLGYIATRRARTVNDGGRGAAPPVPWFVLGFIALMLVNSVFPVSPEAKAWIVPFTNLLLSMALAAMGLETNFGKLRAKGLRPLGLAATAWIFIAVFSLALVKLMAYS